MIDPVNPDFSDTPASAGRPAYRYCPAAAAPPVVSIITPFYNTGEVFAETARSVFGQSFQEWEWIVVDDGSTDPEAAARLASIREADSRVKVLRQANRGPSAARNAGVGASAGRYLCLLDSDDMLEPTFIEKMLWFLESQPDFAFCNAWSVHFGSMQFLWRVGFEQGKRHVTANCGPNHSVIRRSAFDAVGGFDETIEFGHEDWDLWLALANAGCWGHTLPEFLAWYRRHGSGRFARVMGSPAGHRAFRRYIATKYPGLADRFPQPRLRRAEPYADVTLDLPFRNRLSVPEGLRRILALVPGNATRPAARAALGWLKACGTSGHEVTVVATGASDAVALAAYGQVTPDVFALPHFLHPADFPRFISYLIQSRSADTVLINATSLGYQLLPSLRCWHPGVVFVGLSDGNLSAPPGGDHPRFALGYQDALDLNIVSSSRIKQWMLERGADPQRLEVCHPGVDFHALSKDGRANPAQRAEIGMPDSPPGIVLTTRVRSREDCGVLAEILRGLASRGLDFQCLVMAESELLPWLGKLARTHGIGGRMRLFGDRPDDGWPDAVSAADIVLLPWEDDLFPLVLCEAMAIGAVPVVRGGGAYGDVVTRECGVLVEPGDGAPDRYIAAITGLAADPARRRALRNAGRERVIAGFSVESCARRLSGLLELGRRLARTQPRQAVSGGLARELAALAIEYARLQDWAREQRLEQRILAALRRYRAGQAVLSLPVVRILGRWLLGKLGERP